ncbi:group II intron reverse transcriptase domain-containing protein [Vibrio sp. 16]|uniref:reverse transcriptase/maturase family protein n=1 Tax=Vibrio sp. 16 TaxID=391586 RepID=UPI002FF34348
MKTIRKQYEHYFSEKYLKGVFQDNVVYSGGTGIDNINQYTFRKHQDEQIAILSRKMIAGQYSFTKYKLNLISKGRGKAPREISIPTVRDRIGLRALCDFLQERFSNSVEFQLPQTVVREIKDSIATGNHTGVIKLDVSNFYPSVNHTLLAKQLNKRLRKHPDIVRVIFSAISVPTVSKPSKTDARNTKGVPQGLSISNILAAIYLQELDRFLKSIPNTKTYRYVDDILILCDFEEAEDISKQVISRFKKDDLEIHCPVQIPHKSMIAEIDEEFDYLGYLFHDEIVSVKKGSIEKLKSSLVSLFTSYKYSKTQSKEFLTWRLDLRITGCVFENKSKGWLFFFSEINDERILHQLDHFVAKLCKRFDVADIKTKKFVRALKEITNRKYETRYVPNFDNATKKEKANILAKYFSFNLKKMTDEEIHFHFHKKVAHQIKDLEADIKDFSSSANS